MHKHRRKRLWALILGFCMVFGLTPGGLVRAGIREPWGDGYRVYIGGEYSSLGSATFGVNGEDKENKDLPQESEANLMQIGDILQVDHFDTDSYGQLPEKVLNTNFENPYSEIPKKDEKPYGKVLSNFPSGKPKILQGYKTRDGRFISGLDGIFGNHSVLQFEWSEAKDPVNVGSDSKVINGSTVTADAKLFYANMPNESGAPTIETREVKLYKHQAKTADGKPIEPLEGEERLGLEPTELKGYAGNAATAHLSEEEQNKKIKVLASADFTIKNLQNNKIADNMFFAMELGNIFNSDAVLKELKSRSKTPTKDDFLDDIKIGLIYYDKLQTNCFTGIQQAGPGTPGPNLVMGQMLFRLKGDVNVHAFIYVDVEEINFYVPHLKDDTKDPLLIKSLWPASSTDIIHFNTGDDKNNGSDVRNIVDSESKTKGYIPHADARLYSYNGNVAWFINPAKTLDKASYRKNLYHMANLEHFETGGKGKNEDRKGDRYALWAMTLSVFANGGTFTGGYEVYADSILPWYDAIWDDGKSTEKVFGPDQRDFAVPYGTTFDGLNGFLNLLAPSYPISNDPNQPKMIFNGWVVEKGGEYYKLTRGYSGVFNKDEEVEIKGKPVKLSGEIENRDLIFDQNYKVYATWTNKYVLNIDLKLKTGRGISDFDYKTAPSRFQAHGFELDKDGSAYVVKFKKSDLEDAIREYYDGEFPDDHVFGHSDSLVEFDERTEEPFKGKPYIEMNGAIHELSDDEITFVVNPVNWGQPIKVFLKYDDDHGFATLAFVSEKPIFKRADPEMKIKLDKKDGTYKYGTLSDSLVALVEKEAQSKSGENRAEKFGFSEFLKYVEEHDENGFANMNLANFPKVQDFREHVERYSDDVALDGARFTGWYDIPQKELRTLPDNDSGTSDSKGKHRIIDKDGNLTDVGRGLKIFNNKILYAGFHEPNKVTLNLMYNPLKPDQPDGVEGAYTVSRTYNPRGQVYKEFAKRYAKIKREGYLFKGWYRNPEGRGEAVDLMNLGDLEKDITLYARWVKSIEITFYANNGTSDSVIKVFPEGDPIIYPTEFRRDGYVIDYWSLTRSGAEPASGVAKENETEYYAQWIRGKRVDIKWFYEDPIDNSEHSDLTVSKVGDILEKFVPYSDQTLKDLGYTGVDWYESDSNGKPISDKPVVFDDVSPVLTADKPLLYFRGVLKQYVDTTIIEATAGKRVTPDAFPGASVDLLRDKDNKELLPDNFAIIIDFYEFKGDDNKLEESFNKDSRRIGDLKKIGFEKFTPKHFNLRYVLGQRDMTEAEIEKYGIEGIKVRNIPFSNAIGDPKKYKYSDMGLRLPYWLAPTPGKEIEDKSSDGKFGFDAEGPGAHALLIGVDPIEWVTITYWEDEEAYEKKIAPLEVKDVVKNVSTVITVPKGLLTSKLDKELGWLDLEGFSEIESNKPAYKIGAEVAFDKNTNLVGEWNSRDRTKVYYIDDEGKVIRVVFPKPAPEYNDLRLYEEINRKVTIVKPQADKDKNLVLDKEAGYFLLKRANENAFTKITYPYKPEDGDQLKAIWRTSRVIFDANGSKFVKNQSSRLYKILEANGTVKDVPKPEDIAPWVKNGIEHYFTGWIENDSNDPDAQTIDFETGGLYDSQVIYARWRPKKKVTIYFKLRGGGFIPEGGGDNLREPITGFVEPGKPMTMQLIDALLADKMGEDSRSNIKYVDVERQVTKVFSNLEDQTTYNGENLANLKGSGNAPDSNEIRDDGTVDEVNLYYEYISNPVTVTFNKNCTDENIMEPKPRIVEKGDTIREPKIPQQFNPEKRTGYTFKGWYKTEEDAKNFQDEVRFPFYANDNMTLYAGWEGHSVYIIYRYNNGMGNETRLSKIGDKLEMPTFVKPVWPGMVLDGWYVTIGPDNVKKIQNTMIPGVVPSDSKEGAVNEKDAAKPIQAKFGEEIKGAMLIDAVWKFDPNSPAAKAPKADGQAKQQSGGMQASSTPGGNEVLSAEATETGESNQAPLVIILLAGAAILMVARKIKK